MTDQLSEEKPFGPQPTDRPEQAPITITLPPSREAVYVHSADPALGGTYPAGTCLICLSCFEDGEHVRRWEGSWAHEKCAVEQVTNAKVDAAWLLIADAVTRCPSAFKASDIRAVLQNVTRIARRTSGVTS